jgi:hypothetical protein
MRSSLARWALGWLLAASAARAVIIAGSDGTINTTAPGDDPGWANVGSSGVYLGSHGGGFWVLTATHLGAGSITFSSGTYAAVPGSALTIRNSNGTPTDLLLFRIAADPGLPSLTLASAAPAAGSTVVMIGDGANRAAAQSFWSVNTNGNSSGSTSGAAWTWQALPDSTGANASGYAWGSGSTKRWGTNQIDGTTTYDIGTGSTTAFYTDFDAVTGEAQGATGDSGGAVFFKNGARWELAGILGAVGTYNNQPASTAVFGDVTYVASVPAYYSTIMTAIPEPAEASAVVGCAMLALVVWRRRACRR